MNTHGEEMQITQDEIQQELQRYDQAKRRGSDGHAMVRRLRERSDAGMIRRLRAHQGDLSLIAFCQLQNRVRLGSNATGDQTANAAIQEILARFIERFQAVLSTGQLEAKAYAYQQYEQLCSVQTVFPGKADVEAQLKVAGIGSVMPAEYPFFKRFFTAVEQREVVMRYADQITCNDYAQFIEVAQILVESGIRDGAFYARNVQNLSGTECPAAHFSDVLALLPSAHHREFLNAQLTYFQTDDEGNSERVCNVLPALSREDAIAFVWAHFTENRQAVEVLFAHLTSDGHELSAAEIQRLHSVAVRSSYSVRDYLSRSIIAHIAPDLEQEPPAFARFAPIFEHQDGRGIDYFSNQLRWVPEALRFKIAGRFSRPYLSDFQDVRRVYNWLADEHNNSRDWLLSDSNRTFITTAGHLAEAVSLLPEDVQLALVERHAELLEGAGFLEVLAKISPENQQACSDRYAAAYIDDSIDNLCAVIEKIPDPVVKVALANRYQERITTPAELNKICTALGGSGAHDFLNAHFQINNLTMLVAAIKELFNISGVRFSPEGLAMSLVERGITFIIDIASYRQVTVAFGHDAYYGNTRFAEREQEQLFSLLFERAGITDFSLLQLVLSESQFSSEQKFEFCMRNATCVQDANQVFKLFNTFSPGQRSAFVERLRSTENEELQPLFDMLAVKGVDIETLHNGRPGVVAEVLTLLPNNALQNFWLGLEQNRHQRNFVEVLRTIARYFPQEALLRHIHPDDAGAAILLDKLGDQDVQKKIRGLLSQDDWQAHMSKDAMWSVLLAHPLERRGSSLHFFQGHDDVAFLREYLSLAPKDRLFWIFDHHPEPFENLRLLTRVLRDIPVASLNADQQEALTAMVGRNFVLLLSPGHVISPEDYATLEATLQSLGQEASFASLMSKIKAWVQNPNQALVYAERWEFVQEYRRYIDSPEGLDRVLQLLHLDGYNANLDDEMSTFFQQILASTDTRHFDYLEVGASHFTHMEQLQLVNDYQGYIKTSEQFKQVLQLLWPNRSRAVADGAVLAFIQAIISSAGESGFEHLQAVSPYLAYAKFLELVQEYRSYIDSSERFAQILQLLHPHRRKFITDTTVMDVIKEKIASAGESGFEYLQAALPYLAYSERWELVQEYRRYIDSSERFAQTLQLLHPHRRTFITDITAMAVIKEGIASASERTFEYLQAALPHLAYAERYQLVNEHQEYVDTLEKFTQTLQLLHPHRRELITDITAIAFIKEEIASAGENGFEYLQAALPHLAYAKRWEFVQEYRRYIDSSERFAQTLQLLHPHRRTFITDITAMAVIKEGIASAGENGFEYLQTALPHLAYVERWELVQEYRRYIDSSERFAQTLQLLHPHRHELITDITAMAVIKEKIASVGESRFEYLQAALPHLAYAERYQLVNEHQEYIDTVDKFDKTLRLLSPARPPLITGAELMAFIEAIIATKDEPLDYLKMALPHLTPANRWRLVDQFPQLLLELVKDNEALNLLTISNSIQFLSVLMRLPSAGKIHFLAVDHNQRFIKHLAVSADFLATANELALVGVVAQMSGPSRPIDVLFQLAVEPNIGFFEGVLASPEVRLLGLGPSGISLLDAIDQSALPDAEKAARVALFRDALERERAQVGSNFLAMDFSRLSGLPVVKFMGAVKPASVEFDIEGVLPEQVIRYLQLVDWLNGHVDKAAYKRAFSGGLRSASALGESAHFMFALGKLERLCVEVDRCLKVGESFEWGVHSLGQLEACHSGVFTSLDRMISACSQADCSAAVHNQAQALMEHKVRQYSELFYSPRGMEVHAPQAQVKLALGLDPMGQFSSDRFFCSWDTHHIDMAAEGIVSGISRQDLVDFSIPDALFRLGTELDYCSPELEPVLSQQLNAIFTAAGLPAPVFSDEQRADFARLAYNENMQQTLWLMGLLSGESTAAQMCRRQYMAGFDQEDRNEQLALYLLSSQLGLSYAAASELYAELSEGSPMTDSERAEITATGIDMADEAYQALGQMVLFLSKSQNIPLSEVLAGIPEIRESITKVIVTAEGLSALNEELRSLAKQKLIADGVMEPDEILSDIKLKIWEVLQSDDPKSLSPETQALWSRVLSATDGLALVREVIDDQVRENSSAAIQTNGLLWVPPEAETNLFRRMVGHHDYMQYLFGCRCEMRTAEGLVVVKDDTQSPFQRALFDLYFDRDQCRREFEALVVEPGAVLFWRAASQLCAQDIILSDMPAEIMPLELMGTLESTVRDELYKHRNILSLCDKRARSGPGAQVEVRDFLVARLEIQKTQGLWSVYFQTAAHIPGHGFDWGTVIGNPEALGALVHERPLRAVIVMIKSNPEQQEAFKAALESICSETPEVFNQVLEKLAAYQPALSHELDLHPVVTSVSAAQESKADGVLDDMLPGNRMGSPMPFAAYHMSGAPAVVEGGHHMPRV